jgi:hypothetical protein
MSSPSALQTNVGQVIFSATRRGSSAADRASARPDRRRHARGAFDAMPSRPWACASLHEAAVQRWLPRSAPASATVGVGVARKKYPGRDVPSYGISMISGGTSRSAAPDGRRRSAADLPRPAADRGGASAASRRRCGSTCRHVRRRAVPRQRVLARFGLGEHGSGGGRPLGVPAVEVGAADAASSRDALADFRTPSWCGTHRPKQLSVEQFVLEDQTRGH